MKAGADYDSGRPEKLARLPDMAPGHSGATLIWLLFWPGPLLTTIVRFESFLTDEFAAGRVSITTFSGVVASLRFWTLAFRPAFSTIRTASTSVLPPPACTLVSPRRKIMSIVSMALSERARASVIPIPTGREIV